MRTFLSILFSLVSNGLFSQDTIKTVSGKTFIGKVFEINNNDVKYKEFDNLEGPYYVVSKNDIAYIIYKNGKKEVFSTTKRQDLFSSETNIQIIFDSLTKKNNKVFIESENENAIIHARNAIKDWGYWIVTKNRTEADFILSFNVRFAGLGDAFGNADFINPQNGKIIKSTKEVNTITSWDMNTKRGLINKIVNKELKRMFSQ